MSQSIIPLSNGNYLNTSVLNIADVSGTTFSVGAAQALTPGHSFTWYVLAMSTNDLAYNYLSSERCNGLPGFTTTSATTSWSRADLFVDRDRRRPWHANSGARPGPSVGSGFHQRTFGMGMARNPASVRDRAGLLRKNPVSPSGSPAMIEKGDTTPTAAPVDIAAGAARHLPPCQSLLVAEKNVARACG